VVKTYCGHGIGDLFHCAPNIPHYAHNKAVGIMKEGMVRHVAWLVVLWARRGGGAGGLGLA
jgi:methionine aminopeptidase